MGNKKIKIFLGAFLNHTNAQNLNCLALAKYLDLSQFTVYALQINSSESVKTDAILFNCLRPLRIYTILGMLWGIIKSDVVYLPKHKITSPWLVFIANLMNKKVFTTIENNMCDVDKESMLTSFGGKENLVRQFRYHSNIFGITQYIIDNAICGVNLQRKPLYLGVDLDFFTPKERQKLRNIVFIGSLKKRKRVKEFIDLAISFPKLNFFVIGDGIDRISLEKNASQNVRFLGQINQNELGYELNQMDLLFLPSRSEGFPKVILEAAASGIPSMLYSDYGASEWINDRENGFIIDKFDQAVMNIDLLLDDPELLRRSSKGAILMSKNFDWRIAVKNWQEIINNLA